MKIAIASDHAGIEVREGLLRFLKDAGHEVEDMGPFSTDRVDYPDYAVKACERVSGGVCAVLICGTGIGMAMSANKIRGIRAAVLHNEFDAEMSRAHNNANVACFGARETGLEMMQRCLTRFLATEFEGGRHEGRVAKIDAIGK